MDEEPPFLQHLRERYVDGGTDDEIDLSDVEPAGLDALDDFGTLIKYDFRGERDTFRETFAAFTRVHPAEVSDEASDEPESSSIDSGEEEEEGQGEESAEARAEDSAIGRENSATSLQATVADTPRDMESSYMIRRLAFRRRVQHTSSVRRALKNVRTLRLEIVKRGLDVLQV